MRPRVFKAGNPEIANVAHVLTRRGQIASRDNGWWWIRGRGLSWDNLLAEAGPVVEVELPDYELAVGLDRGYTDTIASLRYDVRLFRAAIGHDPNGTVNNEVAIDDVRRAYRAMGGQPIRDDSGDFTAHSPD